MTEEIAYGESLADGSIICPSDMKWKVQGVEADEGHSWTCENDDAGKKREENGGLFFLTLKFN